MSTTFKTNYDLMTCLMKIIKRAGAEGDIEILNRCDDRAFELQEYARHGLSGCNYRSEGDINISLVYDGFLEAVIIDEDLLTLDANITRKIYKEAAAKADWLEQIREQQERDYWESQGYTY